MEDNFVSLQNGNRDHYTSVHKDDDDDDGKWKGQVNQKANPTADIHACGVLTCKRTDMHSYTINGSLTNIFMLHRYY